jgi:hypothetical protein
MSHFLIHAARMQDAGVGLLCVRLGTAADGMRLMHVAPDPTASTAKLLVQFPERTFELCGTDRLLEKLEDDMAYADGGPTPEMLAKAIEKHPLAADDLREWYANYLLIPMPTDEELAAEAEELDEAVVQRTVARVQGIMKGLDIARQRDAMKREAS